MAKLRKPPKNKMSAMMSSDVALRVYRNQNIVSVITRPRKSDSPKKAEANYRFKDANNWAKHTLLDPGVKALYAARKTAKLSNAHTVAVADYLNAPTIKDISLRSHTGAIGDKIYIHAEDDFEVVAVNVTISDKNGKELETGSAIQYKQKKETWIYTLTVANPDVAGSVIEVTAMDRPENVAEKSVTIEGKG